jgi:hypothetical protein
VADRPAGFEHHSVDRAELGGVLGELVQVLDDGLLARVGDVQSVVPEPAYRPEQLSHVLAEYVGVQQAIDVVQAEVCGLGFVQGRTQRGLDAGTDQPDQIRLHRHRLLRAGVLGSTLPL